MRQNVSATLLSLATIPRVDPANPPVPELRPLSNDALSRWHRAICAEMRYRLGGPEPLLKERA